MPTPEQIVDQSILSFKKKALKERPMKIIKNYEKALQAIYDHVGFVEIKSHTGIKNFDDCTEYTLAKVIDSTGFIWEVEDHGESTRAFHVVGHVYYAKTKEEFSSFDYRIEEVRTERFYKKWIYRGKEFTLIVIEDFLSPYIYVVRYFRLFDNSKEIKRKNYINYIQCADGETHINTIKAIDYKTALEINEASKAGHAKKGRRIFGELREAKY